MDRQIIYPGQVPLETDLLKTNQNVMVGLAKVCEALFGTAGVAVGFGTTQTVVPSLAVLVAPGEVYMQQNLEASAISSLPQDLAHSILKQGIALDAQTLPLTAPGTAGFSVNYLVQVGYQDTDSGSAVLPYYNASNPSIAYAGPANSGAAQPTIRQGAAVVSLKAGTAATTGTQTTPAPDAGKLGLFVVTVSNGATTVVNANISSYAAAPVVATPLMSGRLLNVRIFTSSTTYTPTPGTSFVEIEVIGGGGGGGGVPTTAANLIAAGSGGQSAARSIGRFPVASVAGQSIVVGAAGAAGSAGGTSSVGSLITAPGGPGGSAGTANNASYLLGNDVRVTGTGGNISNESSQSAGLAMVLYGYLSWGGLGGSGPRGSGGIGGSRPTALTGFSVAGLPGLGYGAGGGGAMAYDSNPTARAGGNGSPGVVFFREF